MNKFTNILPDPRSFLEILSSLCIQNLILILNVIYKYIIALKCQKDFKISPFLQIPNSQNQPTKRRKRATIKAKRRKTVKISPSKKSPPNPLPKASGLGNLTASYSLSSLLACATLQSFISFVVGLSPPGILYFSNGKFLYGYWVSFHWRSQINICWMYLLINIFCIFNKNIVFSFWGFWSESQLSHIYDPFSFKSKIVKLNLDRKKNI